MSILKRLIQGILRRYNYQLVKTATVAETAPATISVNPDLYHILPKEQVTYAYDQLYSFHNCDFINEARFRRAYELGKATDTDGSVLCGTEIYWRIHVLCWAASQAMHLDGDFVDCGVNTGIFSRAVIDYTDFAATGKTYYLLDTFAGLEPRYSSEKELAREMNQKYNGQKDTLYRRVQETFSGLPVKIIRGAVPDTLPEVAATRIAYLSVDMNCVQPEVDALAYFWDKIVPGGVIILDDYGYCNAYMDQKHAHDAFARSKGVEILTLPTCQGMIVKPY